MYLFLFITLPIFCDCYWKPGKGKQPLTFEEIMVIQKMYGVQDKIAFRHDPFMMHQVSHSLFHSLCKYLSLILMQTNGYSFVYDDPISGTTHNASLISLFMERIINEMMTYFNLPSMLYIGVFLN